MSNAGRTTTTLDIRVNARDLNKLDKSLKETFGARAPADFNRGMNEVARSMQALVRQVQGLTRELTKQSRAGKQYKDLAADMAEARREAEKLRHEIERLKSQGPTGAAPPPVIGGYGGGSGGGGGGYSGSPQLGMPNAGSIATALSAVPGLGLIAAGGTMASFQMYGSALRHQTAKRDTFAYLGPQGAEMHNLRRTQRGHAGAAVGGIGGTLEERQAQAAVNMSGAVGEAVGNAIIPGLLGPVGWAINGVSGGALTREIKASTRRKREERDARLASGRSGDREDIYQDQIVIAGSRALGSVARSGLAGRRAQNSYNKAVAVSTGGRYIPGQATKWNADMGVDGLTAVGARYGLASPQAMQEASQLSQAMGQRTTAGTYDFARGAQTAYGVGLGQTGDIMQSARYGMGMSQQGGTEVVARLIGAAVSRGLEGSEISQYLSGIQDVLKKQMEIGQEGQGIEGLLGLQRRLNQTTGLSGRIAGSMGLGLATGASQLGYGGGNEAMRFEMLKGMGWDGSMGDYTSKMLDMQDPNKAAGGIASVVNSIRARTAGMDASTQTFMMQQALSQVPGMQGKIGADAAGKLSRMGIGMGKGDSISSANVLGVMEEARVGAVGLLEGEAGMENKRITQGYRSAGQVQALNNSMISLAAACQNVLGPALDTLTDKIAELTAAAETVTGPGSGAGSGAGG